MLHASTPLSVLIVGWFKKTKGEHCRTIKKRRVSGAEPRASRPLVVSTLLNVRFWPLNIEQPTSHNPVFAPTCTDRYPTSNSLDRNRRNTWLPSSFRRYSWNNENWTLPQPNWFHQRSPYPWDSSLIKSVGFFAKYCWFFGCILSHLDSVDC